MLLLSFANQKESLARKRFKRALGEILARKQTQSREQAFGGWENRGDSRKIVDDLREEWKS